MRLKLACADFTFPLLEHDAVLDLIALLGFEGVDIGLFEGRSHLWPSRVFKKLDRSRARAGRQARRSRPEGGRRLSCKPRPTSFRWRRIIPTPADAARPATCSCARSTSPPRCGSRHVSALPGRALSRRAARRVRWPARATSWPGACEQAAGRTAGLLGRGPRRLDRARGRSTRCELVQRTPGLTLTLDYTHFTKLGIADDEIEPLVPHASHFHARGACKGRLQASFKRQHDRLRPSLAGACESATTRATSASNTCGSTGSTATRSTTCRRRSCCAIFSSHRMVGQVESAVSDGARFDFHAMELL